MSGKSPVIYWDTNVFLAFCKNETKHGEDVLKAIDEIVRKIEANNLQLATSAISLAELVKGNPTDDQVELIERVFSRSNIHLIDTNRVIAELAGEIYKKMDTRCSTKLTIPDCIHLASASYYKCTVFYTLDGINGKRDGLLTIAEQLKENFGIKVNIPSIEGNLPLPFSP